MNGILCKHKLGALRQGRQAWVNQVSLARELEMGSIKTPRNTAAAATNVQYP